MLSVIPQVSLVLLAYGPDSCQTMAGLLLKHGLVWFETVHLLGFKHTKKKKKKQSLEFTQDGAQKAKRIQ